MNQAQELWKYSYLTWSDTFNGVRVRNKHYKKMGRLRREAALERIVARQAREIEAQAAEIKRMQTVIDDLDGFSGSFAATMLLSNRPEYKP